MTKSYKTGEGTLYRTGEGTTSAGDKSGINAKQWIVAPTLENDAKDNLLSDYLYGGESSEENCRKWNAEIRDLGDEQYELNSVLSIVIEEYPDEGMVIARHPELELFGEGENEADAMQYLKEDIIRLYEDLINEKMEDLGPLPRSWQRILRKLISKG